MKLTIIWAGRAEKDRNRLDGHLRRRILAAIERYAATCQGDVKKLQGPSGDYRLRVGDWRVVFAIDTKLGEMHVKFVSPRGGAYHD